MGNPSSCREGSMYSVIFIWVIIHVSEKLDCRRGGIYKWVVKIKGALLISAYSMCGYTCNLPALQNFLLVTYSPDRLS